MISDEYYLTERQMAYAFDKNHASSRGGWCQGSTVNPSIAHAITVRSESGQQRSGVSNFVCAELPEDFPVEELQKMLWM